MVCLYVHVAQMALLLTLSPAEEHTHTFVLQWELESWTEKKSISCDLFDL